MTNSINDIHKYKKALRFVKELAKLESSMRNALIEIEPYKHYIPAQECIEVLTNSITIVKTHLDHQKKIVENKGET